MNFNHMVLYLAASQEILELTFFFSESKPTNILPANMEA